MKKLNIAIVAGGYSPEHQISLQSADTVLQHLDREKYQPFLVIIDESGWHYTQNGIRLEIDKNDFSLGSMDAKIYFDAIFIVIHGRPGENGELQAYFDVLDIPYTTSSSFPLAVSFNKYFCNCFLKYHGIRCAKSLRINKLDSINLDLLEGEFDLPYFIKSNESGSSYGVNFVKHEQEIIPAFKDSFLYSEDVIVEEYIEGTEVSCGILQTKGRSRILGITEIVSGNEFFDYEAKYKGQSKEITPARLSSKILTEIEEITKKSANLLRLSGLSRIDFIVKGDLPYFLEANSVPGLSAASIIPQQAAYAQMTLTDLFSDMIEEALRSKE